MREVGLLDLMDLTFLEASVPLTKTIRSTPNGIEKSPYPHVARVTSHHEQAASIAGMYDAITEHAAHGRCLLKGNTARSLVDESRANSTSATEPTSWICLDIDGLPAKTSIDAFLHALGIDDVSHVIQYSASQGIGSPALRCHVFVWLSDPASPLLIKQWLIYQNLTVPLLATSLSLSSTHMALRYGLDVTTCQNDKLLYIAPPKLIDIKDPFGKKPRIKLVERSYGSFNLDLSVVPSAEINRKIANDQVNRLRSAMGLNVHPLKTTKVGSLDVLPKPDGDTQISGIKSDRGFTYLNLNGGDSWGYYHPDSNPDYIHNFKGEPSYRTKELLPAYFESVVAAKAEQTAEPPPPAPIVDGIQYLAFCDRRTSAYFRGTYDTRTNELHLSQAKTETQIKHFLKQHGQPVGDFIPEWDRIYDPTSVVRVNVGARTVNLFEPSKYMQAQAVPRSAPPPTILKAIHHVLGGDETVTRHFINWLAFIVQRRTRTLTAWILHGTSGTGKGILIDHIIRPLFGNSNVATRTQDNLAEKWTDFLENSLFVFVDEMEHSALENSRGVMAKLKHLITEKTVAIRSMNRSAYETQNRTNWMFASNRPNPVAIDREDRRMNVGNYQGKPTPIVQSDFPLIESELQHFHDYLAFATLDLEAVRTPLVTQDRNNLISISESSVDDVMNHIRDGDFEFLIEQLPTDDSYKVDMVQLTKVDAYVKVLKTLIERTDAANGTCNIGRDELKTLLTYISGVRIESPNKFTAMMKHHKTVIQAVWLSDISKTVRGIPCVWKDFADFDRHLVHITPARQPLRAVK